MKKPSKKPRPVAMVNTFASFTKREYAAWGKTMRLKKKLHVLCSAMEDVEYGFWSPKAFLGEKKRPILSPAKVSAKYRRLLAGMANVAEDIRVALESEDWTSGRAKWVNAYEAAKAVHPGGIVLDTDTGVIPAYAGEGT